MRRKTAQQTNEETTMKCKMAFAALSAAIALGSASAALAGPTQTWEDIANAHLAVQREIADAYHLDTAGAHSAYATVHKHKHLTVHEHAPEH
jgi:hypothetical protein